MLNRLYEWYGKRVVWSAMAVVAVLVVSGALLAFNTPVVEEGGSDRLPLVSVARVGELTGTDSFRLVGTVESVSEVRLESEVSGRVTRVPVALGQRALAGQIIAEIENASEYAALLQAEGAYEAALAAGASSDVGVEEAKNAARSAYRSAYATVTDILGNTVDDLFANPNARTPGLKISGGAQTSYFSNERYALNDVMEEWERSLRSISASSE